MGLPDVLGAQYDARLKQARNEADHEIYSRLIKRNYTVAQINTWALLEITRVELASMFLLRTLRARLAAPQIEILDQTLEKLFSRLDNDIPLNASYVSIDSVCHDDNHLPRSGVHGGRELGATNTYSGF